MTRARQNYGTCAQYRAVNKKLLMNSLLHLKMKCFTFLVYDDISLKLKCIFKAVLGFLLLIIGFEPRH